MNPPKVLFTIAGLHPESGGPSRSVTELCAALAHVGATIEVVSLDYGKTFGQRLSLPPEVKTTFLDCSSPWARKAQWTGRFRTVLRERCRSAGIEIVHDTGMWLMTNHAAAAVSSELDLPRVVSPRGMLTQWALRHKGWKKRAAWWLYQRRDLQSARLLHATSPAEIGNFRVAGMKQPIAMIPNGVEIPPPSHGFRPVAPVRTLLFLGRVHPIKGLLDLIKAWAMVKPSGWRVTIAGGDEMGHRADVEAAVNALGLANQFNFLGPVGSEQRWETYRGADLFVLPSHSENFGIVVAEALACGIPVIATKGTPWEELVSRRCGWWTEIGASGLADALRDALVRPLGELREMGQRGRQLVQERYGWPGVAVQMYAVYEWMLGHASKPACIVE